MDYDAARKKWENLRMALRQQTNKDFVPHILRHTNLSRLAMGGMPIVKLKEWAGHTAIQTTMRYAHLSPDATDEGTGILEAAQTDFVTRRDQAQQSQRHKPELRLVD